MLEQTHTIPIIFVIVADPVGSGFVASLPRPGGNATGFTVMEPTMSGKWLELLKEIAPRVNRCLLYTSVIDELGYLPFSQSGGQLLFHLISKLYELSLIHI